MADVAGIDAKPVRQRLLDAGEALFSAHGWNGVSVRDITSVAKVSLAALNYHFGEKEKLLAAIFAARAKPIAAERQRLLAELQARGDITLDAMIEAFLRPALTVDAELGGKVFAKLRARLATEPQAFSRKILADAFDESSREYLAALQRLLPELAPAELAWRFHVLLGAMAYTMADPGRIQSLTDGLCDPGDVDAALRRLVPFLAAGFRSPAPAPVNPVRPARRKKN